MFCFQKFFHSCPPPLYANPAGVVDEELNPDSVNPVTNAALSEKFTEVDEQIEIATVAANVASASAIATQQKLQSLVENDIQPLKDAVAGLGDDAAGAIQNAIDAANAATYAANRASTAADNTIVRITELEAQVGGVNGLATAADQKGIAALTRLDQLTPQVSTLKNDVDDLKGRPAPNVYITGVESNDVPAFIGEPVNESVRSYNILTEYSDGTRVLRCKLTGATLDASLVAPNDPAYIDFIVQIERASDNYSLSGMFCSAPNCQSMPLGPHAFAHCGDIRILSMETSPTVTTLRMKLLIIPVYREEGAFEVGDISFEIVMYKDGVY